MHSSWPSLSTSPKSRLSSLVSLRPVSQPCGLKNDLLRSKPLCACSRLKNRDSSRPRIDHRVRWVVQLYQKTSLILYRWVVQASSTGLPEAFTCPATLDRPGRLDLSRSSLWSLRFPRSFTTPFLGSFLCLGVTSHHLSHHTKHTETTTRGQNHLTDLTTSGNARVEELCIIRVVVCVQNPDFTPSWTLTSRPSWKLTPWAHRFGWMGF